MSDRKEDRHKNVRSFPSGATKRKAAAEKAEKLGQLLGKTHKLSNFFPVLELKAENHENPSTSSSPASVFDSEEQDEPMKNCRFIEEVKEFSYNPNLKNDIGLWTEPSTNDMIDFWIKQGPSEL